MLKRGVERNSALLRIGSKDQDAYCSQSEICELRNRAILDELMYFFSWLELVVCIKHAMRWSQHKLNPTMSLLRVGANRQQEHELLAKDQRHDVHTSNCSAVYKCFGVSSMLIAGSHHSRRGFQISGR